MAIAYRKVTLANGVRLVLVSSDHATSVKVRAMINVGSRHETDEVAGAAHLLEHMLFKGTRRRPKPMDINTEVSVRGAESNASTSQDQTEYHVRAASKELPWAMDLIHDMVSSPSLDPEELERERKVVLEELTSYEDDPSSVSQERAFERLFHGSTLGRPIIGYRQTVKSIARRRLARFHAIHYRPANIIVVVSGGFNPDEAAELAKKTFGRMESSCAPIPGPMPYAAAASKPSFIAKPMDFAQTHVSLCFRGCAFGETKQPAQKVLSELLGGDMCSRLWLEIRELRGLAYSISAGDDYFVDTGTLLAAGELNAERSVEAVGLMARECAKLADMPVSAAELDRARSMLSGQHALYFESPHAQASYYAHREFYGAPAQTPQARLDKVLAVTAEDIQAAAQDIFRLDRLSFVATGKVRATDEYRKAIKKQLG